ncbi:tetratricopeptide repeat protein [candidate division KSB1 bacterium]|nr:tetratricopeptide repeat protein [candidate division KSB1 bacterium]
MSKRISVFVIVMAAVVFTSSEVFAQEEYKPTLGIGFNGGIQKPFCDVLHTGLSLAGEGFMRFLISDGFNVRLGVGYGELSDGFSYRTFHTTVFNADLKAHLYLVKSGAFRPYAALGFGAINYTYHPEDPPKTPIGDPALGGKAFWDVAFIAGGGADIMLSRKIALTASADYRHTTTDGLDGALQGTSKDGFLTARLGLVFFSGQKPKSEQELLAEAARRSAAEPAVVTPVETDDETADILALLMGTKTQPTTEAPAAASDLQKRVDELKKLINSKEQEIATMQNDLSAKDTKILDLQRELDQLGAFTRDFSSAYREGLRLYSLRQHDKSIAIFRNLRENNPRHKLASNCIYWIGENYFLKRDYVSAIEALNAVFNYDFSYKTDDATLMLGRCYNKLGQNDRAIAYFQELITKYPDSEYIAKARQWIERIQ